MNENLFVQAIGLARAGRKAEARKLLQQLLESDNHNELVWLWFAECVDTVAERIRVLETCLRINPQAQRAGFRLSVLRQSVVPEIADLGHNRPVFISRTDKENKSLTPEEWAHSAGAKVFTVPPEHISAEEFWRIEKGVKAY